MWILYHFYPYFYGKNMWISKLIFELIFPDTNKRESMPTGEALAGRPGMVPALYSIGGAGRRERRKRLPAGQATSGSLGGMLSRLFLSDPISLRPNRASFLWKVPLGGILVVFHRETGPFPGLQGCFLRISAYVRTPFLPSQKISSLL